jgi:Domain of unknown function (DUF4352)/Protein of unknown function (DUF2510)
MTTPPTPAGWYPDIEVPGGLRYWDGTSWTEHRTPPAAPAPPAAEVPASEQPTSVVSLPDQPTRVAPLRPAEESGESPAAEAPAEPTPTLEPPGAPPTWEVPPLPSWDAPSTPAYQAPVTPAYGAPSYESPQFAPPPPGSPPGGQFGPPAKGGGNNKAALAILGAVLAVALIATLAVVYFFVIKRDDKSTTASTSTSQTMTKSTTTKTSKSQSSETAPTSPQASGNQVTDGDLSIAFSRTDTGDTITSSISDSLQVTAKGEYFVVYFNVTNNGSTSDSLLLAQQKLKAGDQSFDADPEANFYLTGTATVDVAAGSTEEVGVVFDVPVGTTPDSIEVFGGVTSSGVNLPLS